MTNNILRNILHIQSECEEYFAEYCQSCRTLLWLWITLWRLHFRMFSKAFGIEILILLPCYFMKTLYYQYIIKPKLTMQSCITLLNTHCLLSKLRVRAQLSEHPTVIFRGHTEQTLGVEYCYGCYMFAITIKVVYLFVTMTHCGNLTPRIWMIAKDKK
jgi:hypothetical protein